MNNQLDQHVFALSFAMFLAVQVGFAADPPRATRTQLGSARVTLSEPIVVALSAPGEKRWGFHQFPTLSRLPDGRLLVTYNATADADSAYGHPGPAFVSADDGRTWTAWTADDPLLTVSHSAISPVANGEFLCVPMSPSLSVAREKLTLPGPVAKYDAYGEVVQYRLSDLPPRVQEFVGRVPALRWLPQQRKWQREEIVWDTKDALVRCRKGEGVFCRPYIDNRLVQIGKRLYYPSYHLSYPLPDGTLPKHKESWCMVSDDNGRSWQRHGLIAHADQGDSMRAEPSLVETASGELACLLRSTDQRQRPLWITHSRDGGRTWEPARNLFPFGVMPQTLRLGNDVVVATFGRPGVQFAVAEDREARNWSPTLSIAAQSCGYTRLLALDQRSLLIAYSDFNWPMAEGKTGKAILVRRVEVDR